MVVFWISKQEFLVKEFIKFTYQNWTETHFSLSFHFYLLYLTNQHRIRKWDEANTAHSKQINDDDDYERGRRNIQIDHSGIHNESSAFHNINTTKLWPMLISSVCCTFCVFFVGVDGIRLHLNSFWF